MKNNRFVLAITGPAGAGKSTIAENLAKQLEQCINIDADYIKHMIVSGFHRDDTLPGKWRFSEWELVGESIGLLAYNFQQHGYNIIINGYIDEHAWAEIQKQVIITHKVLLLPHLDTTTARDKLRYGDFVQGEESVKHHHDHFSNNDFFKDFLRIDSTALSVDTTIDKIKELLV